MVECQGCPLGDKCLINFGGKGAPKCASKTNVENFNNLQQLKAEIRAISDIIEVSESGLVTVDFACLKQRLRELSAV